VLPIQKNIDYLKLLKKLGNTIIIHTARRMRTSNGNPGKAIADIGKITFDTLHKYDIPYDEIFFGKPYADYYIDDLAINANSSLDKAIGIYDTNIPPRSFNKIEYESNSVIKQTTNLGEVYWYNNMPVKLKKYFPSLIDSYKNKLVLEYVDGISYSYMYSNKTLILADVDILLDTIKDIHSVKIEGSIDISSNYTKKLQNRYLNNLELYSKYENSENIYQKLLTSLTLYEESFKDSVVVIHGDPVFTNVIRTKNGIKLIDMLGKQGDELTLLGDPYYDYAKIYQSIIGYDFILNNFEIDSFYVTTHKKYFESQ
jgi:capsule biosynthesis phosphatase